jgi:hypothetical protein
MFKQAPLDFVGEPATGIAETKDAGDVALDGAAVRQCDGIDDAAQKAALREARLFAGTICWRAGRNEIPIERNAVHGWFLSFIIIIEFFSYVSWLCVESYACGHG